MSNFHIILKTVYPILITIMHRMTIDVFFLWRLNILRHHLRLCGLNGRLSFNSPSGFIPHDCPTVSHSYWYLA